MNILVPHSLRTALTAAALPLLLLPATTSAQTPELVFLSGITATSRGGAPLTTVEDQTAWLADIGFIEVGCHWRHLGCALFGGQKSAPEINRGLTRA